MSLERVMQSARRLGVPVIVTDPHGKDPMVILPLEQFEALTGDESAPGPRPIAHVPPPPPRTPDHAQHVSFVDEPETFHAPPMGRFTDEGVKPPPQNPEISLDERFYLEPLDEQAEG